MKRHKLISQLSNQELSRQQGQKCARCAADIPVVYDEDYGTVMHTSKDDPFPDRDLPNAITLEDECDYPPGHHEMVKRRMVDPLPSWARRVKGQSKKLLDTMNIPQEKGTDLNLDDAYISSPPQDWRVGQYRVVDIENVPDPEPSYTPPAWLRKPMPKEGVDFVVRSASGDELDVTVKSPGTANFVDKGKDDIKVTIVGAQSSLYDHLTSDEILRGRRYTGGTVTPYSIEDQIGDALESRASTYITLMLAHYNRMYEARKARGLGEPEDPKKAGFRALAEEKLADAVTAASAGAVNLMVELDKPNPVRRVASRVAAKTAVRVAQFATHLAVLSRKIAPNTHKDTP